MTPHPRSKPETETREISHSHLSRILVLQDVPQAHELKSFKGSKFKIQYLFIAWNTVKRLNFSTSVVGTFFSSKVMWYFETSLGKVTNGELTFLMFKFALESATGQAMPSQALEKGEKLAQEKTTKNYIEHQNAMPLQALIE